MSSREHIKNDLLERKISAIIRTDNQKVALRMQQLDINKETQIPEIINLHQNYPNPFNTITTLRYDLPEQGNVNIIIYDMRKNISK